MPSTSGPLLPEIPFAKNVDQRYQSDVNERFRRISSLVGKTAPTKTSSGTISGAELILTKPGLLAIKSNAFPLVSLPGDATPVEVLAYLSRPPVGGKVVINLKTAGGLYFTVTIAANATTVDYTNQAFALIPANSIISGDIVSVPQTFPGADLSVIIRF